MVKADRSGSKARVMSKFTPAPDELVRSFEDAMKEFPAAEPRKVFGYPAAFVNGQMFAGLHQDHMILRLPEAARIKFLAEYKTGLFEPMPGRPMREYVLLGEGTVADEARLAGWLNEAFVYAASLPAKEPKPRAAKRSRGPGKGDRG